MATVALEQIEKCFPAGGRALVGLDLSIDDGELLVVVGPSGCGKSTLLRLVAGLEAPSRGLIRIGGQVVNDVAPRQRNVAMVFQDYALYPNMTVRGNLEFPLRMTDASPSAMTARVAQVADMLGLAALLDRLPRQLSGGQRQRVAMGRALVREPSVFLMDEPLSNLDAKLRGQVRGEIASLQRDTRATMIYVTHDQVEAMTLGDRVAVLDRGVLQQVAAPRDIYQRPANAFVATFIGTPPMNVLPATLTISDRTMVLRVGRRALRVPAEIAPALLHIAAPPSWLGVRAEDLRVVAPDEESSLAGDVLGCEYLGHETMVQMRLLDAEGATAIVRLPGTQQLDAGTRVHLVPEWTRCHYFAQDGRRLDVAAE